MLCRNKELGGVSLRNAEKWNSAAVDCEGANLGI